MAPTSQEYKPVIINRDFIRYNPDFEQYALLYSKGLQKLFEESNDKGIDNQDEEEMQEPQAFGKYVKINNNGKVIYRKCRAECHIRREEVGLGIRTQKELGIGSNTKNPKVILKKAFFISFYLCNSDKYVALTAWLAVTGFFLSLLSLIISVLSYSTR